MRDNMSSFMKEINIQPLLKKRSSPGKNIIGHTASNDPNFKVPRNLSNNEHVPFLAKRFILFLIECEKLQKNIYKKKYQILKLCDYNVKIKIFSSSMEICIIYIYLYVCMYV